MIVEEVKCASCGWRVERPAAEAVEALVRGHLTEDCPHRLVHGIFKLNARWTSYRYNHATDDISYEVAWTPGTSWGVGEVAL